MVADPPKDALAARPDDLTGLGKVIGAVVEPVPGVGGLLKALAEASPAVRRMALFAALFLVLYPIFVVFGVLTAIQALPDKAQGPIAAYVRHAIGTRSDVNLSNKVIDGSTPMTFELAADNPPAEPLFEVVDHGQAIDFLSYERSGPGQSKNQDCKTVHLPNDTVLGHLVISNSLTNFKKAVEVKSGEGVVRTERGLKPEDWKDNEELPGVDPVQLTVSFLPDPTFKSSDYLKCFPVTVYVNMIFKKPALS